MHLQHPPHACKFKETSIKITPFSYRVQRSNLQVFHSANTPSIPTTNFPQNETFHEAAMPRVSRSFLHEQSPFFVAPQITPRLVHFEDPITGTSVPPGFRGKQSCATAEEGQRVGTSREGEDERRQGTKNVPFLFTTEGRSRPRPRPVASR